MDSKPLKVRKRRKRRFKRVILKTENQEIVIFPKFDGESLKLAQWCRKLNVHELWELYGIYGSHIVNFFEDTIPEERWSHYDHGLDFFKEKGD